MLVYLALAFKSNTHTLSSKTLLVDLQLQALHYSLYYQNYAHSFMADRILQDPRLEVLPDHAGPHYNEICQLLVNTGLTLKQAIQSNNDSWMHNYEEWVQAWDQQQEQSLENECVEVEKKKPKMNDFEEAMMVSSYIAPCPSQYALHHLENFICFELWYLTQEGCADAVKQKRWPDWGLHLGPSRQMSMVKTASVTIFLMYYIFSPLPPSFS